VTHIDWPEHWQAEARERVTRYFGGDERPRIVVGDPATSIDGTVIEGYVYLDGKVPTIIHDRSGRSDVYLERLLRKLNHIHQLQALGYKVTLEPAA
jgi:hypothetical protein